MDFHSHRGSTQSDERLPKAPPTKQALLESHATAAWVAFFRRLRTNIISVATHLGDAPKMAELIGPITMMTDAYKEGTIDRLFLVHNMFVNTMSQTPEIRTLLPVEPVDAEDLQDHWDYIYEPDAAD